MFGWISLMMRKSAQICMIPTVCTVAGSAINRQKPRTVSTARQKTEHIWPMDPKDRATFLQLSMDSCATTSASARGFREKRGSEQL